MARLLILSPGKIDSVNPHRVVTGEIFIPNGTPYRDKLYRIIDRAMQVKVLLCKLQVQVETATKCVLLPRMPLLQLP